MRRVLAAVLVLAVAVTPTLPGPGRGRGPDGHRTPMVISLAPEALGDLPEARYDAVIPGLDAVAPKESTEGAALLFALTSDVALYGSRRDHAVARLAAHNFLGDPTVVLGYRPRADGWQLILTPARRQLPSAGPGATAQTYGWVRAAELPTPHKLMARIEISVSAQRVTIRGPGGTRTFPAGVGGDGTPTPTGVTGYLQARYLDPEQGQSVYPIQLTSLHAVAADEPYGGSDGGLIGIHLGSGASHGCIRLGSDAIAAVNALPVGTPVELLP